MGKHLDELVELTRRLRDLGVTRFVHDGLEVEFSPAATAKALHPDSKPEPMPSAEDLLFFSSQPDPDEPAKEH